MPTISFDIPEVMTANVRGREHRVENVADWPVESLRALFEYGFQRRHNDACGQVDAWFDEKTGITFSKETDAPGLVKRPKADVEADCMAMAAKVTDNLSKGIIRAVATRISDPVKALAIDLAEADVVTALRAAHPSKSESALRTEFDIRAAANDMVATDGDKNEYMATAKRTLDAASKIKVKVDLTSIKTKPVKPTTKKTEPATK